MATVTVLSYERKLLVETLPELVNGFGTATVKLRFLFAVATKL